jgi:uncharacterized membrane protein YphA (DoxX/SURF4 family)
MTATTIQLNPIAPVAVAVAERSRATHTVSRKASIVLWVVQVLLAALFLFAGGFKLVAPIAEMTKQIPMPGAFLRFIGVAEVTGALGLVLPGLFRVQQHLTPIAAGGLVIIMSGAVGITMAGGQLAPALMPLMVGILAGSVAYGRRSSLESDAA